MTRQDQQKPWWERPARTPGEPRYVREREQFRAELARAWRARDLQADRSRAHVRIDPRARRTAA